MRGALFVLGGLVGGVAGAVLVHVLSGDGGEVARVVERREQGEPDARLNERVAELEERLRLLESRPASPQPAATDSAGKPRPGSLPGLPGGKSLGEADPKKKRRPPPEFVADLIKPPITRERYDRLWGRLIRHPEDIDAVIEALAKAVEDDPENPERRVMLAKAYVAKLVNATAPGPQQGLVWSQAAAEYNQALKRDPEHWDAKFDLAFGTSQAPDFLGLRPQAIKQFEELLEQQERDPLPKPHYVQTYFQLGTIYKNEGNAEKAREIWARGLRLFPENEAIREALGVLEKR